MNDDLSRLQELVRAGATALQQGDATKARAMLEQVTATGRANAQIWMLLAAACNATNDPIAEEAAVDEVLRRDGNNIRALIQKGDCRLRAGDDRAGASFHDRAVKRAEGQSVPADLAAELDRVRQALSAASTAYRQHLEGWVGTSGRQASSRFSQSLDILFGDRQIYQQQPLAYYFPELPQRQFYEREEFDWVPALEAATDEIRSELTALLAEKQGFRPYLVSSTDRPRREFHGLNDNPAWSTLHLFENGRLFESVAARAPRTWEAMQHVPLCRITVRAPTIMFSLLQAGARIPAHTGQINTRLICHLPLIVPPNCGFRVGNETREWEVGKLLIFDDTIEHEAWNDSDEDRVVLIFDIWRPELNAAERAAVAHMFEGIDSYGA